MSKYKGVGTSALKYCILNFFLMISAAFLDASVFGGGTGDGEEGLWFLTFYWIVLLLVFVIYGLISFFQINKIKPVKKLTSLPLLISSPIIAAVLIHTVSQNKYMYDGAFLNNKGLALLELHMNVLTGLILLLVLFAIAISVLGIVKRQRYSIAGLLLNLALLVLHYYNISQVITRRAE